MSIIDIFSKRQKQLRGEVPDVYTYDTIPEPLRVQIIYIWAEAIGDENRYNLRDSPTFKAYKYIVEILCKEYGLFVLTGSEGIHNNRNYLSELVSFLLNEWQVERVLDAIELSFQFIKANRNSDAIVELNARFREHGVGYVFDDEIIRVDSQFLHAETVKPALALLRTTPEYAGAQAEFLTAHDHYRHGRPKESLTKCLKIAGERDEGGVH